MMVNHQKTWHGGVHTHSTLPFWSSLPWHSSMSGCGSHLVCYLMASMGCGISTSHQMYMILQTLAYLLHITWSLHQSFVDAPADVHSRSHSLPLIHPREVCLAWHWVIIRPLFSHGIFSLSLPLGVGLTGVGLVHLSHAWQTPTPWGNASFWCDNEESIVVEDLWLSVSSLLLHRRGHLSWSDAPPHMAYSPTCLLSSPFP